MTSGDWESRSFKRDQKDERMTGAEKVIKHLEMTQAVINRLGNHSFLLKSWSMTAILATMVLIARQTIQNPYLLPALVVPVLGFWTDTFFGRKGYSERSMMKSGNKTTPTSRWM